MAANSLSIAGSTSGDAAPALVVGSSRFGSGAAMSIKEIEQFGSPMSSGTKAIVSHRGYVAPVRQTGWVNCVFIILADLIGTGIMGLPYTFSKLGWLVGSIILLFFGVLTWYSGFLLWRLHMTYPSGITYGDMAEAVSGKTLKWVAFVIVYVYFFLKIANYLLVTGRSLQTLFWMYDVCLYYCLVGCLVVLIPLVQLKTLHQVSYVGALSVIMIIATVLCLMGDAYATWGERQAENVQTIIVGADGFGGSFAAITNLVFAYGGQNLYLETMAEMRNPADFKKSLIVFSVTIVVVYLWSALSLYFRYGQTVYSSTLYNLDGGPLKTAASLFMFIHVAISYCLNSQVFNRALHVRLLPHSVNRGDWVESMHWLCISLCTVALTWLVANVIPFFSDLQGIITSFCTGPTTYGLPALMYILACRKEGKKIPLFEMIVMCFMMFIAVLFVAVGGVTNTMKLIGDWSTFGAPFACILGSE